jgi:hypothetical protein
MEETTTNEFFRSVGSAFSANGPRGPGAIVVLVLAGAIVGAIVTGFVRRLLARRAALATFVERHALDGAEVQLVRALAKDAAVGPLELLTHLDAFERATERALAAARPGAPGDPAERIGRIRHAVGFDRLPAHAPLLSTRELSPGTAVQLGDGVELRRGVVIAVDERALRVELDGALPVAAGDEVQLSIVHAREARYAVRGRAAWVRPAPLDTTHLSLSHDEAPRRVQRREHVRVAVGGAASLRPLRWPGVAPARRAGPPRPVTAQLLDVSAGGLRVLSPEPLPVGLLAEVGFAVAGERFDALHAVVLSSGAPSAGGGRELHLELSAVPEHERDRLTAAVARAETRGRAAATP